MSEQDLVPQKRFSRRKRDQARQGKEVSLHIDDIPSAVRTNICNILHGAVNGTPRNDGYWATTRYAPDDIWEILHNRFSMLLGRPVDEINRHFIWEAVKSDIHETDDIDTLVDLIENAFQLLPLVQDEINSYRENYSIWCTPEGGIAALNRLFRNEDVGYEFSGNQINLYESEFVTNELTVPGFRLLRIGGFEAAERSFREAHESYRHGKKWTALVAANSTYESVIKEILKRRKVEFGESEKIPALVRKLVSIGILYGWQENHQNALTTLLESNVNTVRGKFAAHGQTDDVGDIPQHMVAFGMHLAASSIIMLIEAHLANPHEMNESDNDDIPF